VEGLTSLTITNGALGGSTALELVVSVDSGTSKLALDGQSQRTVVVSIGATHTFDTTAADSSGQTFKLSTTEDGEHGAGAAYTTGVTSSSGSLAIAVDGSTPTLLYYYSVETAGMGGRILIDTASVGIVDGSTGTIDGVSSADEWYVQP